MYSRTPSKGSSEFVTKATGVVPSSFRSSVCSRVSSPDLAGQDHEPLALLDAIDELRQGFAVRRGQEQELRVRRRIERLLIEHVEVEVHGEPLSVRLSST
jgi:hypothetical protein